MAEGLGFEPERVAFAGFQDRSFQPLKYPSALV